MSDTQAVSVLYALLAGLSLHAAWLTWLRPYVPQPALVRVVAYVALALAFVSLAIGRAGWFGLAHGQNPWVTRAGFLVYGGALVYDIARHWLHAWRCRPAGHGVKGVCQ